MARVRKVGFLVVWALGTALMGGGCDLSPAERVEAYRLQLERLETLLVASDAKIEAMQAAVAQGAALLTDPNVGGDREQIAAQLERVQAGLAAAQVYKAQVQTWIGQTRVSLEQAQAGGGIDLPGELGLIGGAVQQGGRAIGGAAGVYVTLAGLVLSLVGNVVQKQKGDTLSAATRAIVRGVEATPADAAEQVKAAIGERMKAAGIFDKANAIVDQIKGV